MTLFGAATTPPQQIVSNIVTALLKTRQGVDAAEGLFAWSSGVTRDELMAGPPDGPGLTGEDADAILAACADAGGFAALYRTGTDPRNPPAGTAYGASMQRVIGPRIM